MINTCRHDALTEAIERGASCWCERCHEMVAPIVDGDSYDDVPFVVVPRVPILRLAGDDHRSPELANQMVMHGREPDRDELADLVDWFAQRRPGAETQWMVGPVWVQVDRERPGRWVPADVHPVRLTAYILPRYEPLTWVQDVPIDDAGRRREVELSMQLPHNREHGLIWLAHPSMRETLIRQSRAPSLLDRPAEVLAGVVMDRAMPPGLLRAVHEATRPAAASWDFTDYVRKAGL